MDKAEAYEDDRFVTPEDPFGLLFHDGPDRLGPILPPIYERDSITGRIITDDTSSGGDSSGNAIPMSTIAMVMMKQQQQLSEQDKHALSMDSMERDMKLLDSLKKHWKTSPTTTTTVAATIELNAIGERIRTTDMATNALGGSVHGQRTKEILDDGTEVISRDTTNIFHNPLR